MGSVRGYIPMVSQTSTGLGLDFANAFKDRIRDDHAKRASLVEDGSSWSYGPNGYASARMIEM